MDDENQLVKTKNTDSMTEAEGKTNNVDEVDKEMNNVTKADEETSGEYIETTEVKDEGKEEDKSAIDKI